MLKQIQPIAQARLSRRSHTEGRRGQYDRGWLDLERTQVERFLAQCDAYLAQPPHAEPVVLERECAQAVVLAREARRVAFAELSGQAEASVRAADLAALSQLCSGYVARVRDELSGIFDRVFADFVSRGRGGDKAALDALADAAGVPADILLVLADEDHRTRLANRAIDADHPLRGTFDALHARFERVVLGYLRARVPNDEHVRELAQETWLAVWDNLPAYNPVRSPFHAFANYWAGIMVRRYGARQSSLRRFEVPASSLGSSDVDQNPAEVLDRLAANQPPAVAPENYAELYTELLRLTLLVGGPPHQLLTFGFRKLAGWPPRRIVDEFGDARLQPMESRLEETYLRESLLPQPDVESCFGPLRGALEKRFDEAVSDPRTLATYPELHTRKVAETVLRAYFTGEPAADVTQWWYAVQRRVKTYLLERMRAEPSAPETDEGASMLLDLARRVHAGPARNG